MYNNYIEILTEPAVFQERLFEQHYKPRTLLGALFGVPREKDGDPIPTGFVGRMEYTTFKAKGGILLLGQKVHTPVVYKGRIIHGIVPIDYAVGEPEVYVCVCDHMENAYVTSTPFKER